MHINVCPVSTVLLVVMHFSGTHAQPAEDKLVNMLQFDRCQSTERPGAVLNFTRNVYLTCVQRLSGFDGDQATTRMLLLDAPWLQANAVWSAHLFASVNTRHQMVGEALRGSASSNLLAIYHS